MDVDLKLMIFFEEVYKTGNVSKAAANIGVTQPSVSIGLARLRKHFNDEEIVELGVFIGINLGFHTFFGSLKFYPLFSPDGRLLTQAESEKLYGEKPASLTGPVL